MSTRFRFSAFLAALSAVAYLIGFFIAGPAVTALRTPSAPPSYFGACPAGQHWETLPISLPECVR